ncbi:MAG: wax ester/triacylglycerol synthase family O-acyltransferase [Acidimicrobiales bacterium]|nr:wax ester/triacylglycerol synthase family O-acyltransferase [Acidimicrobiales bacterium]
MTRLTALDSAFLAFESDRTPTHVGSVAFFEGEPFHDAHGAFRLADVRERIGARLHLVPRLRQRPTGTPLGVAHPLLVDDPDFDIAHHVKLTEVGAPASEAEVLELAAELHMERLDRSRPLWEIWFVDGLADGRVAMVEKIHHSIVDGVSGVEIATVLLDLERHPPETDPPPWQPEEQGAVELLAGGMADRVRQPFDLLTDALDSLRHPAETAERAVHDARALSSFLRPPLLAPRSSLNDQVGHRRRLVPIRRDLAAVKEHAHGHGGTVNDLVLAAVTGGLRQLLTARGELPHDPGFALRALVPVSLHAAEGELGNVVAGLVVDLPVGLEEPIAQIRSITADLREHKKTGEATASARLLRGADLLPPVLTRSVSQAVHHQPFVNLVVTNVPGTTFPLYAMGAELLDAVPIVPLGGNLSISVGVLSYHGRIDLGIFADADACPDLDVLVAGIESAFDTLAQPST